MTEKFISPETDDRATSSFVAYEQSLQRFRSRVSLIHEEIQKQAAIFRGRSTPEQQRDATRALVLLRDYIFALRPTLAAQLQQFESSESVFTGDALHRAQEFKVGVRELLNDADRFLNTINEIITPPQRWTGEQITQWFSDIRIHDRIVSKKSGTERVVLAIRGPRLQIATRRYDLALGRFQYSEESKIETIVIEMLRQNTHKIDFIERKMS